MFFRLYKATNVHRLILKTFAGQQNKKRIIVLADHILNNIIISFNHSFAAVLMFLMLMFYTLSQVFLIVEAIRMFVPSS